METVNEHVRLAVRSGVHVHGARCEGVQGAGCEGVHMGGVGVCS